MGVLLYCIRILTWDYGINCIDQCITKLVLHVYTMDTRYMLCCNNTTIFSPYFTIQQTVLWIHECLVNVPLQYRSPCQWGKSQKVANFNNTPFVRFVDHYVLVIIQNYNLLIWTCIPLEYVTPWTDFLKLKDK